MFISFCQRLDSVVITLQYLGVLTVDESHGIRRGCDFLIIAVSRRPRSMREMKNKSYGSVPVSSRAGSETPETSETAAGSFHPNPINYEKSSSPLDTVCRNSVDCCCKYRCAERDALILLSVVRSTHPMLSSLWFCVMM